jgi:BlaI family transcriptional regulator, penicillinase repressor
MEDHSLTRCELEIMDVVWQRGSATVQDVVDALDRSLAYTTVMTMLRILEEKQAVIRGNKRGRAFVYGPLVTRDQVGRSMTGELTQRLFRGSVKSMVLSLIETEWMSAADIAEIKAAIATLEEQS